MDDSIGPLDDLLELLIERVGEDKAKVIYLECVAAEQFKRGRAEGQVPGDAPGEVTLAHPGVTKRS